MRLSVTRTLDAFLRGETYKDRLCGTLVSTGKILLHHGQPIAFRQEDGSVTTAIAPRGSATAAYVQYLQAHRQATTRDATITPMPTMVLQ